MAVGSVCVSNMHLGIVLSDIIIFSLVVFPIFFIISL